jgi:hypothetical protein
VVVSLSKQTLHAGQQKFLKEQLSRRGTARGFGHRASRWPLTLPRPKPMILCHEPAAGERP